MKQIVIFFISFIIIGAPLSANEYLDSIKNEALKGNPNSQYELACLLMPPYDYNYEQALYWLRMASDKGNQDASTLLNTLTTKGYDRWGDISFMSSFEYDDIETKDQIDQCILLSNKKNSIASMLLARYYFYYKGDDVSAISYYKKVLSQIKDNINEQYKQLFDASIIHESFGYDKESLNERLVVEALSMLGYIYEHGYGVKQSNEFALSYYVLLNQRIDNYDYSIAYNLLKSFDNPYLESLVYKKDLTGNITPIQITVIPESKIWTLLIKQKQYHYFISEFTDCENRARRRDEKFHTGIPQAETLDFLEPCKSLWYGEVYFKGLGVEVNYNKAFSIFRDLVGNELNSAMYGDMGLNEAYPEVYADACYRLYECYADGLGTSPNSLKAEYFFRQALMYGSSSALFDSQQKYKVIH